MTSALPDPMLEHTLSKSVSPPSFEHVQMAMAWFAEQGVPRDATIHIVRRSWSEDEATGHITDQIAILTARWHEPVGDFEGG